MSKMSALLSATLSLAFNLMLLTIRLLTWAVQKLLAIKRRPSEEITSLATLDLTPSQSYHAKDEVARWAEREKRRAEWDKQYPPVQLRPKLPMDGITKAEAHRILEEIRTEPFPRTPRPLERGDFERDNPYLIFTSAGISYVEAQSRIGYAQASAIQSRTALPWRRFVQRPAHPTTRSPLMVITSTAALFYGYKREWIENPNELYNMGTSDVALYARPTDTHEAKLEKGDTVYEWYQRTIREAEQGHQPQALALRPRLVEEAPPEEPVLGDWPEEDGMVWVVTSHSRRRLPPSRFLLAPPLKQLPKPSIVTA